MNPPTTRISTGFLAPVYLGCVIFQGGTGNRMEMEIALQTKKSL